MKSALLLFFLICAMPLCAALIEFDSLEKEVYLSAEADSATMEFHFENKSDKQVTIKRYDAGCSCMQVAVQGGKMDYKPGESGTIRVVYDMKSFSGEVEKSVMLFLNDDPPEDPSVVLTTRIHIPVLVQAEPKSVKWQLGSKPEERVIPITMNHTEPIHVLRITGTADIFQHQLRTVEEGKKYELVLTPKNTNQPTLGIFRIETDCTIEKHRVKQVFAVIRK